ncbi:MAG TPA: hypothetical protein VF384_20265 [Planctomycetota bacterium]
MAGIVWAGPFSRWYARGGGDAAKLRAGVEAWRVHLRAAVAPKIAEQLLWDEAADVTREWDLGDSGWRALRLFAFHAERSDLELPDDVPLLLELDPQWRALADAKFERSKYGHLLACSAWLPGDFPVTLRAPLPDGETAEIGSLAVLADQLKWLNQRTFQADAAEFEGWLDLPAPAGGELIAAARRGYAGLAAAVTLAMRERVPVVVAV